MKRNDLIWHEAPILQKVANRIVWPLCAIICPALAQDTVESKRQETSAIVAEPIQGKSITMADGFDYPVGAPDGKRFHVRRGFTENAHLGDDWFTHSGVSAMGLPVSCIAHGVIVFAKDVKRGWGKVVISRHRYLDSDGSIRTVDAMYAHLEKIGVKEGDAIKRGQKIGTIGDGNGMYPPHLHFEIRKNTKIMLKRSQFARDLSNYHPPSAFIEARRPKGSGKR